MSLINDMLKDLERTRHGKPTGPSLLSGVRAVTGLGRRGDRRPLLAVLILLLGLGIGGGVRLLLPGKEPAPRESATVVSPAPVAAPVTVAEAQPAPATPLRADAAVAATAVGEPKPQIATQPAAQEATAPAAPPAAVAVAGRAPSTPAAKVEPPAPPPPAAKPVAATAPKTPEVRPVPKPEPVKTLPTAAALVQEARNLQKSGQDAAAVERLEQALELEPAAFAPREQLASLHLRQGRKAAARELWWEGTRLSPAETHWRKRLARALLEEGDGAGALAQLSAAAAPAVATDVEFHGLLAAAYQRQGEPAKAAGVYRRLAEQEPRGGIWWLGLAIALEGLRDAEGARNAYRQALGAEGLGEEARAFAAGRLQQLNP